MCVSVASSQIDDFFLNLYINIAVNVDMWILVCEILYQSFSMLSIHFYRR